VFKLASDPESIRLIPPMPKKENFPQLSIAVVYIETSPVFGDRYSYRYDTTDFAIWRKKIPVPGHPGRPIIFLFASGPSAIASSPLNTSSWKVPQNGCCCRFFRLISNTAETAFPYSAGKAPGEKIGSLQCIWCS